MDKKTIIKSVQSRFRSKLAWISILTLGTFVAKTYFKVEVPQADELINLILLVGTGLGIFNDPTSSDKF